MPLYDLQPIRNAVNASPVAQPLTLASDSTGRHLASFFMQRGTMQLVVDVRRKRHAPHSLYLYMGRGDNTAQGSGLGTAFAHEVFRIADSAGVEHVMTRSTEIGRYANAANYIQCNARH